MKKIIFTLALLLTTNTVSAYTPTNNTCGEDHAVYSSLNKEITSCIPKYIWDETVRKSYMFIQKEIIKIKAGQNIMLKDGRQDTCFNWMTHGCQIDKDLFGFFIN